MKPLIKLVRWHVRGNASPFMNQINNSQYVQTASVSAPSWLREWDDWMQVALVFQLAFVAAGTVALICWLTKRVITTWKLQSAGRGRATPRVRPVAP